MPAAPSSSSKLLNDFHRCLEAPVDGKGGLETGRPFSVTGNRLLAMPVSRSLRNHDAKEFEMGRNVTLGIGTLIIILIIVAILF